MQGTRSVAYEPPRTGKDTWRSLPSESFPRSAHVSRHWRRARSPCACHREKPTGFRPLRQVGRGPPKAENGCSMFHAVPAVCQVVSSMRRAFVDEPRRTLLRRQRSQTVASAAGAEPVRRKPWELGAPLCKINGCQYDRFVRRGEHLALGYSGNASASVSERFQQSGVARIGGCPKIQS
ncbi:MAG: hypothetical protein JWQ50_1437 [Caballeronia mineralivorans]|nr:hypothetical protein [Caballeronia mineralivorans]